MKCTLFSRYFCIYNFIFHLFLVVLPDQVNNILIMNELDNGQQEQYSEPKKKKNTQKIVKRTLVTVGLALVVYIAYSIVHLFVSPDHNIQQIYLVPEDAAFIIQSSAPVNDWEKFSGSDV